MSDTRNRTLAAAGAGLGCLTILVGAGAIAAGIGAWVWWTPRADAIRFEGAETPPVTTHEPVRLRDTTVLDQHGGAFETALAWSVEPASVAMLRDGHIVAVGDGTATVTASTGEVSGSYTLTVDVPPDFSGWWISASGTEANGAATYLRAVATAPDVYRTESTLVFRRNGDERRFGALANNRFQGRELCEDNPVLVPIDAPIPATMGCSTLEAEGDGALTFRSSEAGTYTLRRMGPADFAAVAAEVPPNLDRLRAAELAFAAQNGRFVEAGSRPEAERELGTAPKRFASYTGFALVGFEPGCCAVRSAYWVTVAGRTFEAHGLVDADGDGVPAEWVATEAVGPRRVTADGVY